MKGTLLALSMIASLISSFDLLGWNGTFALHIDKPFYMTGETVWYCLYYPPELAEKQVTVKGVFTGPDYENKARFFHKKNEGSVSTGQFPIPFDFESGHYHFAFYLLDQNTGDEITLLETFIPIYNDLTFKPAVVHNEKRDDVPQQFDSGLNIQIDIEKTRLSTRGLVSGTITVTDTAGRPVLTNLSASVLNEAIAQAGKGYQTTVTGNNLMPTHYDPAPDVYVKGVVTTPEGLPLQANVLGAYASNQNKIYYTKSNTEGAFLLTLDDFYDRQSIQFLPYYKEAESIKVKLPAEEFDAVQPEKLVFNEMISEIMERSRLQKKVNQYFKPEKDGVVARKESTVSQILDPNYVYQISEYERFDRVYDFFTELMAPIEFKRTKGKYSATMLNPTSIYTQFSRLPGTPLFIIDGKATRNADFIARLSMSNIETIEIFYTPQKLRDHFNVLGNSGVVKINTIIPQFNLPADDQEDVFEISGLQHRQVFSEDSGTDLRFPDFRPVQYWNPSLTTNSDGQVSFSFPHGDDLGVFQITVVGQDSSGLRGLTNTTYSVQVR